MSISGAGVTLMFVRLGKPHGVQVGMSVAQSHRTASPAIGARLEAHRMRTNANRIRTPNLAVA